MQSAKICNINFFTASLAWASSADHRFCGPRLFPGRHHTVTLSRPRQRRAAHRRSALQYRKFLFFSENFHGGCRAERRSAGPNRIRPNYGPNNVRAKACHGHPARARAWPGWLWHAAGCGSAALRYAWSLSRGQNGCTMLGVFEVKKIRVQTDMRAPRAERRGGDGPHQLL